MFRIVFLLFISLGFSSCQSTKPIVEQAESSISAPEENYQIMVRFKSEGGLKRTLYQLSKLSLEIKEEVSATDFIYVLQLKTKPYAINGTVEKIGLMDDVGWVKRVNP